MKTFLAKAAKKMTSALMSLVLVAITIPNTFAVGDLTVGFDTSAATNFPAGTSIPFSINTNPAVNSVNNFSDNTFPDGTFTITATLPANTQVGPGANYVVTGTNTAQFTVNNGAVLNVTVAIVDTPAAPTTGDLTVGFDTSGASNFPAGTSIPFSINTNPAVNSVNNFSDNTFPAGTFTVTATLPANTEIVAGANYTVVNGNNAQFTMVAGNTLNLTIAIGNSAGAPGGGTSDLTIGFDSSGASNFPAGTSIPFSINTNPPVNSVNNFSDNTFPVGTFSVTATIPANTQIVNGANYTVTGPNTVDFTTTNGGTLNITIALGNLGAPAPGSSVFSISFDTSTASNFPAGTSIPFAISTTPPVNSVNNFTDNAFPVGTFTLTVTLPANTELAAGAGYAVIGTNSASFTTSNGGTLNLVVSVANSGAGGAGTSSLTVGFDSSTSANFPAGTGIPFTINTVPPVNSVNNFTDNTFPVGTFTLVATLPPNTSIGPGNGYTVSTQNSAVFTTTNGGTFNLSFNIVDGNNGGSSNNRGGRRRIGTPSLAFFDIPSGQTATEIDFDRSEPVVSVVVEAGSTVAVAVQSVDPGNFSTELAFADNPTEGEVNQGTLNVQRNFTAYPVGTFVWNPGTDQVGNHEFRFSSSNRTYTGEEMLTVVVTAAGGGSGGSSGGGSSDNSNVDSGDDDDSIDFAERLANCQYSDNETESVVYLCALGIIDGPNNSKNFSGRGKNNRYFGRQSITRAAFTKIMVNITYEESAIEKVAKLMIKNNFFSFPDVDPKEWYSSYITVAKLDKHVSGYPHLGMFVPWQEIEISEALKVVFNTASHDNDKIKEDLDKASEREPDPWFMRFARLAHQYKGFKLDRNKEAGLVYSQQLSRQEAADVVYAIIENAGIEPKSKLSTLREELEALKGSQHASASL